MLEKSIFTVLVVAIVANASVYDYGSTDRILNGTHQNIFLDFEFFFGTQFYQSVTITNGGFVFFGDKIHKDSLCDIKFHSIGYENNPYFRPVIGPFGNNTNSGLKSNKAYYRFLSNETLLEEMSKDVATSFPNFEYIKLRKGLIITWEGISAGSSGKINDERSSECRNSIVQLVLGTDELFLFAFFKYDGMKNCQEVAEKSFWIGFDAGIRNNEELPMSCHASASTVSSGSNVNIAGTYIFRVDGTDEFFAWLWVMCIYYLDYLILTVLGIVIAIVIIIVLICICCCGCCACCCASACACCKKKQQTPPLNMEMPAIIEISPPPPLYTPTPYKENAF